MDPTTQKSRGSGDTNTAAPAARFCGLFSPPVPVDVVDLHEGLANFLASGFALRATPDKAARKRFDPVVTIICMQFPPEKIK